MTPARRRADPESDLLSRVIRNRPETLARSALTSWAITGVLVAEYARTGSWGRFWPLMILPIGLTMIASIALLHRDPERAGMDAFRSGVVAMIPSALVVGWMAVRRFENPMAGHIATASMAGASVGSVVGALCGPVAGWAVRAMTCTVREWIRRSP
ncbi:hypothetical protein [Tautonia rosea]|uniref:hypothetical protein n=1 Tax=Tautonia rosea TaxID=2728037 RepID=UPI0014760535|nr:hypothetical protein [Tautonia rosea]